MTAARTPRPVEVELKYRVDDSAVAERYLDGDSLATFAPASPVRRLVHFDSPRSTSVSRFRNLSPKKTIAVGRGPGAAGQRKASWSPRT